MADPNIPTPYIPSAQWALGESIDNTKWHQRFDTPMDALGNIDRTWGQQWGGFFGVYYGSSLTAGQSIPVTPLIDTAGGWDSVAIDYVIPNNGQYLIGGQCRNGSASALTANITDGARTWSSPLRASGTNISAGVGVPIRAIAGDLITFFATQAVTFDTTATYIANWMYVYQVGW